MRISDWSSDVCSSDLLKLWHGVTPALGMSIIATAGGAFLLWRHDAFNRIRLALPRPEAKTMFDATVGGLAAAANVFTDGLHNGSLRRYLAFFSFATLTVVIPPFLSGAHSARPRPPTPGSFVPLV